MYAAAQLSANAVFGMPTGTAMDAAAQVSAHAVFGMPTGTAMDAAAQLSAEICTPGILGSHITYLWASTTVQYTYCACHAL